MLPKGSRAVKAVSSGKDKKDLVMSIKALRLAQAQAKKFFGKRLVA
ncbi:hypothetical protein UFOVP46_106 [uncultured Caudovirales phage]|uniref:Uncharacterized protein n=1 Tax=uncultured Caudovirales phage TaxID=2100421 RepID=A0A6J5KNE4_9CAUD|nr:hypothetical protein UFOVP46_106 [uncultured Caudovirales phage]